jgi:murein DD-endopeptidase MepM/ murein hydrolase activator NlpD
LAFPLRRHRLPDDSIQTAILWGRRPAQASWTARARRAALPAATLVLSVMVVALLVALQEARSDQAHLEAAVAAVAAKATTTSRSQETNLAAIAAALETQEQTTDDFQARLDSERRRAGDLRYALWEQAAVEDVRQQTSAQETAALKAQANEQRQQLEERQRQLDETRQQLDARTAELAGLNEQVAALGQRVESMAALAGRLGQMLGLPVATGPAGGDEPAPTPAPPAADAAELSQRLQSLDARSGATMQQLTRLDQALQQRINHLQAMTASGRRPLSAAAIAAAPVGWPVHGPQSSGFGMRESPIDGEPRFHPGLDLVVGPGTLVRATREGVVTMAGPDGNYGLVVMVRHAAGFETLYAHNSQLLVRAGQYVERGQPVARSGNTGASTGPHVHYEVHYQGTAIDPEPFLEAGE